MIDFDIAKTWHKIFAEKLEFVVMGLIEETCSPEQICDDSACKLGNWLHGPGKQMEGLPAYTNLLKTHQHFHEVAYRYLSIGRSSSDDNLKQDVEADFKNVSARVIAAIERLQVEAERTHQQTGFTSQFQNASLHRTAWDESLTIGLPAIDEQHKAIAAIVDKLMKDPEESLHSEFTIENLTDLGRILEMHFAVEEAYMQRLGMTRDEFEAHRQRHFEIVQQYVDMNIASYKIRDMKIKDIAQQIMGLAIDHVVEYDLNIRKYLPA
jgi:hemerythrin-like metal-binding protein